jgi:hypothetical protein
VGRSVVDSVKPAVERPFRRGCGRSIRRGELTLTASKRTFMQATGDAMNVSEALSSGHWRCHVAGQP